VSLSVLISSASTSFWQETWCYVLFCGYGRCLSRQVPAPTIDEETVNQSCFGVSCLVASFVLSNGSLVASWWDCWEFLGISIFLCCFGYKGGSCTTCQCLYWQTVLVGRFLWYQGRNHHLFTSRIPYEESCEIRKPDLNQPGFHWDLLFAGSGAATCFMLKIGIKNHLRSMNTMMKTFNIQKIGAFSMSTGKPFFCLTFHHDFWTKSLSLQVAPGPLSLFRGLHCVTGRSEGW